MNALTDPPEIASTKDWVHTSPGLRAELSCIVIAEPPAKVNIVTCFKCHSHPYTLISAVGF